MPSSLVVFIQGLALGVSASAAPGPFQTYLVNQTLLSGWRKSINISFAPLIADIPIVLITVLLLDQVPASLMDWISAAGGCFILYIAWKSWGQWRRFSHSPLADPEPTTDNQLLNGILMNLLSPGPYAFWALVNGPLLISAINKSWFNGLVFIIGFYGALITGFMAIALIFSYARKLGQRYVQGLLLISVIILVLFGCLLLGRAVMGIVY
ncbi:MAG: LysE family transporter [Anaerolineales bacterium]|nr:LysE family transporter [Anaerolineales bacterium]